MDTHLSLQRHWNCGFGGPMHMRLCAALFGAIGCYAVLWRCRAVLCGNMRLWAALDLSGSVAAKK
jgi:hypothetical protein